MIEEDPVFLIYDTECPVCSIYCRYIAITENTARFELVSAREEHPLLEEVRQQGLNLDEGFVLKIGERWYHGADALHMLSLLAKGDSLRLRLNYWLFKSPLRSRFFYPLLASGRTLLLRLLGRSRLSSGKPG